MTKFEKILLFVLILIAFLSLFLVLAFRTEAAEIKGNVQFGYIEEIEAFEVEINIQFIPWYFLTFYGGVNVLMEHYEGISYCPFRDHYIIGGKINITEHLYIDLYHHCVHPVYSYSDQFYDKFGGGDKTRLSVGIEWGNK